MGRTEYWNDPAAPKPNSLVPACGILAVDDRGRVLLQPVGFNIPSRREIPAGFNATHASFITRSFPGRIRR